MWSSNQITGKTWHFEPRIHDVGSTMLGKHIDIELRASIEHQISCFELLASCSYHINFYEKKWLRAQDKINKRTEPSQPLILSFQSKFFENSIIKTKAKLIFYLSPLAHCTEGGRKIFRVPVPFRTENFSNLLLIYMYRCWLTSCRLALTVLGPPVVSSKNISSCRNI